MPYLLAILATYYIAHVQAGPYDGPFGLSAALKEKIDPEGKQDTWLRRGIQCPVCLSFWISLLMAFFLSLDPAVVAGPGPFLLAWLGTAGGATIVHLILEWIEDYVRMQRG